jgi:hypothetical protein
MNTDAWLVVMLGAVLSLSCNGERKAECDRLLAAMKPLEQGGLGADAVDSARQAIDAIQFQDQPLREYASSAKATLTVLSNTLRVQASDSAPDGTDDLVKDKRKEALGEEGDVAHYCSE